MLDNNDANLLVKSLFACWRLLKTAPFVSRIIISSSFIMTSIFLSISGPGQDDPCQNNGMENFSLWMTTSFCDETVSLFLTTHRCIMCVCKSRKVSQSYLRFATRNRWIGSENTSQPFGMTKGGKLGRETHALRWRRRCGPPCTLDNPSKGWLHSNTVNKRK